MKIKAISRRQEQYTRTSKTELMKVHRNPAPALHPFEKARELTRAVNAAKLDRIFAKPFIGAMSGHMDSISCMALNPTSLVAFLSGCHDGEVRVWDVSSRRTLWSVYAHASAVRGIVVTPDGGKFLTCGDDKKVHLYNLKDRHSKDDEALQTFAGTFPFTGIDHQHEGQVLYFNVLFRPICTV
jgi:WD repeat and SOF domain-containing protein 1